MKLPTEVSELCITIKFIVLNSFHFADRSLEMDLRAFGLENIDSKLIGQINQSDEWYRLSTEVRLSDVTIDVHKLENHHRKLTEDILKSQQSIKALKE